MGLIPACQLLIAITGGRDFIDIECYAKIMVLIVVCRMLFVACCVCHKKPNQEDNT
jgi:hypothetical protein